MRGANLDGISKDDDSIDGDFLLERPFYFYVVLWGERFRNYFLEYCLPSLLAPGNIPALRTRRRSKMLIATLPEDWAAMKATAIFRLMERYVDAVYLEIPPCPPRKSGCEHMGIGHKAALDLAHRDQAYGILTVPDCLFSDGSIAALQQHARHGVELVMVGAALRLGEEPFLGRLTEMGALPPESRRDGGFPVTITGRQMARAALTGMHSEARRLEWDAHYLPRIPPGLWWRVPGEDGIVLLALSWAPMLVDYGAIGRHDTSCLEQWTIDGDYAFKNFGRGARMHVVQDSDEIFYAGFGPLDDRPHILEPDPVFRRPLSGRLARIKALQEDFYGAIFDPLKRDIFFLPIRWHAEPLNAVWKRVENRAVWSMVAYLSPDPLPASLTSSIRRRGGPGTAPVARWLVILLRWRTQLLILWIRMAAKATSLLVRLASRIVAAVDWVVNVPRFVKELARAFWKRRQRALLAAKRVGSRLRAAS